MAAPESQLLLSLHSPSGTRDLGSLPPPSVTGELDLPTIPPESATLPSVDPTLNPFASIIPFLTSLPVSTDPKGKHDSKSPHFLITKGLPTLPTKLVERAWNWEYVDMEEFLPAPRSLRLVEQRKPVPSLQESLVGALNHFQAIQQQKAHQGVLDVLTWIRCFTLYMAVMSKKHAEMIQFMVAHLHTVLRLYYRAPEQSAWLEYDIQYRMETAASGDRKWSGGDPWRYLSCLPGPSSGRDPFDISEKGRPGPPQPSQRPLHLNPPAHNASEGGTGVGKGKRPSESGTSTFGLGSRPPAKKPKKAGVCRLFNSAPNGCPYGKECVFTHRCTGCGVVDQHGRLECPHPTRLPRE